MMAQFTVYTDVSYSQRLYLMVYAAIVLREDRIQRQWTGVLDGERRTSIAEVMASIKGLRQVPDGSDVTVYTDVADLPDMAVGRIANGAFRTTIAALRAELARMSSFNVRRVYRGNEFYKACHDNAWAAGYQLRLRDWKSRHKDFQKRVDGSPGVCNGAEQNAGQAALAIVSKPAKLAASSPVERARYALAPILHEALVEATEVG